MAKRHKHEEHVNHERWVISFADMMTLLFALFVVLYAMSVQDTAKIEQVVKSIQFAFNIEGDGKTREIGLYNKLSGAGDAQLPAALLTAQDGPMKEFIADELEDFRDSVGKSLEVVMTDDSISMIAPVSRYFRPGRAYPVREDVAEQLDRLFDGSLSFTSTIRVRIEFPTVALGRKPDGSVLTSKELCIDRVQTLGRIASNNPQVLPSMVNHEFVEQNGEPGAAGDWEERAKVVIAFSNGDASNR